MYVTSSGRGPRKAGFQGIFGNGASSSSGVSRSAAPAEKLSMTGRPRFYGEAMSSSEALSAADKLLSGPRGRALCWTVLRGTPGMHRLRDLAKSGDLSEALGELEQSQAKGAGACCGPAATAAIAEPAKTSGCCG